MASQITGASVVYSTVFSGADQTKHQCSASLAFVRGIHRWPVNFPHKGPVTWKMIPFGDVIMMGCTLLLWLYICSYDANTYFWIQLMHVLIKIATKVRYRGLFLKLNRATHATKQSPSFCSRYMVIHYRVCLQIYSVCGHLNLSGNWQAWIRVWAIYMDNDWAATETKNKY